MRRDMVCACLSASAFPPATKNRRPDNRARSRSLAEQEQLHQLDAFNLAIGLKRAIYDAGYTCNRITDAGFVGTWKNLDMWMARCVYDKGLLAIGRFSPDPTEVHRCAIAATFPAAGCPTAKSRNARRGLSTKCPRPLAPCQFHPQRTIVKQILIVCHLPLFH